MPRVSSGLNHSPTMPPAVRIRWPMISGSTAVCTVVESYSLISKPPQSINYFPLKSGPPECSECSKDSECSSIPIALSHQSLPEGSECSECSSIPRALSYQSLPECSECSEGSETEKAPNFSVRGSGGGYLLSHFRSTIGVVRLNFSVRNGKRWIPHAITTLMRLRPLPFLFCWLSLQLGGPCIFGDASTDKPRMAVSLSR